MRRIWPQLEAATSSMSGPVMIQDLIRSAASDAQTGGNPESKSRWNKTIRLVAAVTSLEWDNLIGCYGHMTWIKPSKRQLQSHELIYGNMIWLLYRMTLNMTKWLAAHRLELVAAVKFLFFPFLHLHYVRPMMARVISDYLQLVGNRSCILSWLAPFLSYHLIPERRKNIWM